MKLNKITIILIGISSSFAFADNVALSPEMVDKKMDEFAKLTDYYSAEEKMYEARNKAESAKNREEKTVVEGGGIVNGYNSNPTSKLIKRSLRGRSGGDDFQGDSPVKPAIVAYVGSTYGGDSLKAEVNWGDMTFVVGRGDSIIGGSWVVKSVEKGSVLLKNAQGRGIHLTGSPLDISKLFEGAN